jgi:hypothetical protein
VHLQEDIVEEAEVDGDVAFDLLTDGADESSTDWVERGRLAVLVIVVVTALAAGFIVLT